MAISFREKAVKDELSQEVVSRSSIKWIKILVAIIGTVMALFHLYTAYFGLLIPLWQRTVHVVFIMSIGFLLYPASKKRTTGNWLVIDSVLSVIGVLCCIYLIVFYKDIVMRPGRPTDLDAIMAFIMIAIILELGRRSSGAVLPILTTIFLLYALFGKYMPSMIRHSGIDIKYLAYYLYSTTEGIWGLPVGVSAKYVYLFMIFGALLVASGCGQLIMDCANAIAGKARGGPAKVAVVSSALFGSISGSAVANVVTTGTFTIPMMKKLGYKPEYAGAVEAVASTGGIIMPPIMGSTAFVMAEMMAITYFDVVKAAWIPAALFYVAVICMVHLRASRENIQGLKAEEIPNIRLVLKNNGYLLMPLLVLIYLMIIKRSSPTMSVFWSIISILICAAFKKESRISLQRLIECFESTVRTAVPLITAVCMAGIIMGVILLSGLAMRISGLLVNIAGDSQIILLLVTMVVSLILGMGVTSTVAYLIPALLVAPVLVKWGIPSMAANMFVFYFAAISYITPPVAIASYAAAGIADANMWKTGTRAFLIGITGFIVPYMIVYNPALIMEGTPLVIIRSFITACIGVIALAVGIEGWGLRKLHSIERLLCFAATFLLLDQGGVTDIIGLVVLGVVIIGQKFFNLQKKGIQLKNKA